MSTLPLAPAGDRSGSRAGRREKAAGRRPSQRAGRRPITGPPASWHRAGRAPRSPIQARAGDGPDDCWFAGGTSGTTAESFHLYWNGQALTEVDNPAYPNPVASMAVIGGQMFESPTLTSSSSPPVLDQVDPAVPGDPFQDVSLQAFTDCGNTCPVLPVYSSGGTSVAPYQLSAFQLSSDGGSVGDPASPSQMFALAAPVNGGAAPPIVLRYSTSDYAWNQVVGPAATTLPGEATLPAGQDPSGIAAVPGQEAAWLTLGSESSTNAEVEELTGAPGVDGGETWSVSGVDDLGPEQGVGDLGSAGPISCPAANDCWLATSEGWLLNWTDGTSYGQSSDPVYNGADGVISYRPPDDGTPNVPDTTLPPDDSLANQPPPQVITTPGGRLPARRVALMTDEKATVIKGTDRLRFTFKLRAKARVQLLALRKVSTASKASKSGRPTKKTKSKTVTVARSKREVLGKGKRSLIVKLNPKRWPTSLKLDATAVTAATKKKRLGF